eukprot:CAMPEP_0206544058 /NCGR_PEP_ID=MMETSP0325_2-20121206/11286_1 /ASSEMBLY_ACC=CAM_ASM_000347 /TAXON_ID=2866 /ORGANISM="Crypthecodinium cohnii, Strain Seligo" /LENGTH=118 /DNA_ID=CAMNT_0054042723 /DNA_START=885 /DNA_END=1241 /DNA_ORIENTATION=+
MVVAAEHFIPDGSCRQPDKFSTDKLNSVQISSMSIGGLSARRLATGAPRESDPLLLLVLFVDPLGGLSAPARPSCPPQARAGQKLYWGVSSEVSEFRVGTVFQQKHDPLGKIICNREV